MLNYVKRITNEMTVEGEGSGKGKGKCTRYVLKYLLATQIEVHVCELREK